MCLYPRVIKNPKYRVTKKNKGNVPSVSDERVRYVPIGCGVCMECMGQRAREWKSRLMEDLKVNENGVFVTLTFSDESYSKLAEEIILKGGEDMMGYVLDNEVAKLSVERFRERWRKKYGKSIRHWLVTELGHKGTENLHMHGVLWTDSPEDIRDIWKYGYIWRGNDYEGRVKNYVSEATMGYIVKYMTKTDMVHRAYKPIVLSSPGIGKAFLDSRNAKRAKYKESGTRSEYVYRDGRIGSMSKYYRNHLYSDEEKERLWIELLDKNERWVGGDRVDGDDEIGYYKLLKYHRERNREAGYGSPEDWDVRRYEHERRVLKQIKRIERGRGRDPQGVG